MTECLFCKIIQKDIPATIIYEDDLILAFNDIHPKAEVHFLIIPKIHIASMQDLTLAQKNLMGHLMLMANTLATNNGLEGYKVHINTGHKGGQEVFHLHIHVYGNK